MNKNEVRGKARQLKGRVKEAAGVVTGNRHLENEGAAERTGGEIEAEARESPPEVRRGPYGARQGHQEIRNSSST